MEKSHKPPRRQRYRGKNPRRFDEKYKERQPERYADDVAKVLARGKTPAGSHRPIMVAEILEILAPRPGEVAVDCTLGYGGHARELLAAIQPGGRLLGLDVDSLELPKTELRLRNLGFPDESLIVQRMNFAGLGKVVSQFAPEGVDIVLADLGVSSMQLDDPTRGFTFKGDGPLDMRMNPARGRTAAQLLSALSDQELAELLRENSDEPLAAQLSKALLSDHNRAPLSTCRSLAEAIRNAVLRLNERAANETVRRVFQALRIAVNDEFGSLEAFLRDLPRYLKPGGRVAVLTFHSGEDRRVKAAFKSGFQSGVYSSIARRVTRATPSEQRANPRSAPAKLRWAIRSAIQWPNEK
jgi:16S rRNA (cytosine1402-N4)-methyltransferase